MHRALAPFLPAALAAALFTPSFAQDETEISFDDVPEIVMEAALATAPGVTFERVSIEVENGVPIYEFEATDHAGNHIEIDVFEDGSIEEIEMEIDIDDVPAVVIAALEETAPGFTATYVEFSVRDGNVYVYEFEGDYQGRAVDIEIAENGDVLFMSDDTLS